MMVTWFRSGSRERKRRVARQRVAKAGIVFTDHEGRKWNTCVFRRSSVGAWRSKEAWDWSRKVSVVFERNGEERVAVTELGGESSASVRWRDRAPFGS